MHKGLLGMCISRESRVPIYQQIYDRMRYAIMTGVVPPGTSLPSETDFSKSLGVNHITFRRAMGMLENEGLIDRRRRAGTAVTDPSQWDTEKQLRRVGIVRWQSGQGKFYDTYARGLFRSLNRECRDLGLDVVIISIDLEKDNLVDVVHKENIEGIICAAAVRTAEQCQVKELNIPLVALEYALRIPSIDMVMIDSVPGEHAAVEALIKLGHWDIAYVGALITNMHTSVPDSWRMPQDSFMRLSGYRQALEDAGIRYRKDRTYEITFDMEPAEQLIEQLQHSGQLPTAFCCFDDEIAIYLLKACKQAGLRVPADISIVGFGDFCKESLAGELATVKVDWQGMARVAAQRIHERINRGGMDGMHITVDTEFKTGASIGPRSLVMS